MKATTSHDELNSNSKVNISKTFKLVNKRLEKLGLSPQNESASLPELPIDTPLLAKKRVELSLAKEDVKSVGNLETKSLNGKPSVIQKSLTPSPNERDSFASDDASEKKDPERSLTTSTSMGSNSTLTNVSLLLF